MATPLWFLSLQTHPSLQRSTFSAVSLRPCTNRLGKMGFLHWLPFLLQEILALPDASPALPLFQLTSLLLFFLVALEVRLAGLLSMLKRPPCCLHCLLGDFSSQERCHFQILPRRQDRSPLPSVLPPRRHPRLAKLAYRGYTLWSVDPQNDLSR